MTVAVEQSDSARIIAIVAIVAAAALYIWVRKRRGQNRQGRRL